MTLEVFSDYVCPFCWLGEQGLLEFQAAESGVEIVRRAYELRPDPMPTLDPSGEYLTRVWGSSVYPLAKRLGVTMTLPPVQPRTRLAHEAAKWAAQEGGLDRFHAEVFRAFFERGEDIGQIDVLAGIADALGMRGGTLREALTRRWFQQDVTDDLRLAEELGVHSVPAFVADRRAGVAGVQDLATLRQVVEHARAQSGR
ncbi:MAG: DsbA family oxidoreductase [Acidobacteriota bacterium]|nr:DsbA family oxidoreductase [Acidobacteriota bacterium]